MTEKQETVAIVGMGLMGGSLGLALRDSGYTGRVIGFARRAAVREAAVAKGVVSVCHEDLEDCLAEADIVIMCAPVLAIIELLTASMASIRPGTIVTDVGSTKVVLYERLTRVLHGTDIHFVGSHPVCGSEKTGVENSIPDLYRDRVVVVCDDERTDRDALERVEALWKSLGSRVSVMDSGSHDVLLAATSHVPHLLSSVIVDVISSKADPQVEALCGTGFQSMTRLASGSAALWRDIVNTNSQAILDELDLVQQKISQLMDDIAEGNNDAIHAFLERNARDRARIIETGDE